MKIKPMNIFILTLIIAAVWAIGYLAYTLWFELGRAPRQSIYQNEIETPQQTGNFSYTNMIREMISPSNKNRTPPATIQHVQNDLTTLTQKASSIVWFGHSSYLLTLDGFTILVDPVMSGHSSPLPFLIKSFAGTDVYTVKDLPPIDVLLITHDHYDHLDYETVSQLQSKVKRAIVPTGVGEHLRFWSYEPSQITELNWHDSTTVDEHTFTAAPTRHFSGRGLTRNNTLWASFIIKSPNHAIYVGGDSGYGPHFKAIGERYGPFDLAMLESGQYNENWRYIHMMPEETVQAAQDLNAQTLFPVHWGKFVLSLHDWDEPIKRLTQAASQRKQALLTPTLGQVVYLNNAYEDNPWWQSMSSTEPVKAEPKTFVSE